MASNKPRGPFASIHNPTTNSNASGQFYPPGFSSQVSSPPSGDGKGGVINRGQFGGGSSFSGVKGPDLDQGIDMTLSPGRESPGHDSVSSSVTVGSQASSGCRNSTTSIDSGRGSCGSSNCPPASRLQNAPYGGHQHRLSNVSSNYSSSLNSSRQSHHSSNSSIQERHEDGICSLNIHEMINNGVPDEDILTAWLTDLHFEEYFNLFMSAGYDMPTISRMTPEDLTAIGIQNPAHRKKLKFEISKLNITDGLPDYIPGSLEEWLRLLRLEEYHSGLVAQGYTSIHQVATINIEDLEDTGFYRLGHQKRLVLAIRRVKDLSRGTSQQQQSFTPYTNKYQPQEMSLQSGRPIGGKTGGFSSFQHPESHSVSSSPFPSRKVQGPPGTDFGPVPGFQPQGNVTYNPSLLQIHRPQIQTANIGPNGKQQFGEGLDSPAQMPDPMPPLQYPSLYTNAMQYPGSPRFTPRAAGGLGHPPDQEAVQPPGAGRQDYRLMQRSYDDADILRHADHSVLIHNSTEQQGERGSMGGTLPRLKGAAGSGGVTIKQRPVAKIIANTRQQNLGASCEYDAEDVDLIKSCDNNLDMMKSKSGTSSPNMTLQRRSARSGSDAGIHLKRNSSFDSDSGSGLPFANDNAGTIRMRSHSNILLPDRLQQPLQLQQGDLNAGQKRNAGDVLHDIGSMLSDLTDELDAMLKLDRDEQ